MTPEEEIKKLKNAIGLAASAIREGFPHSAEVFLREALKPRTRKVRIATARVELPEGAESLYCVVDAFNKSSWSIGKVGINWTYTNTEVEE